jgi:hypothetical protein
MNLFLTIAKSMENHDDWFKLRRSASEDISVIPLMKCTRMFKCFPIGAQLMLLTTMSHRENVILEVCQRYTSAVIDIFGLKYLRAPNEEDIGRLMGEGVEPEWLGMLGSIDCMH